MVETKKALNRLAIALIEFVSAWLDYALNIAKPIPLAFDAWCCVMKDIHEGNPSTKWSTLLWFWLNFNHQHMNGEFEP